MTSVRKPTRPTPRWLEHAARASTPDDRLTVAYDRLRAVLTHLRRKRRDPLERAADAAAADRLAADAAAYLTSLCEEAERGNSQ
jgi:hypothetical protein